MRSASRLAVSALLAVVLAAAFSWLLTTPAWNDYFDAERGFPREELTAWWRIRLPAALVGGFLLAGSASVALAARRRGAPSEALGAGAVALLAAGALAGAFFFLHHHVEPTPEHCEPATPTRPADVFLDRQWRALAAQPDRGADWRSGDRLGPLTDGGIGLARHPGFIPFDPYLLRRVTFVGLTVGEVEGLLGPPLPAERAAPRRLSYLMLGSPTSLERATLSLHTAPRGEGPDAVDMVNGEYMRLEALPEY